MRGDGRLRDGEGGMGMRIGLSGVRAEQIESQSRLYAAEGGRPAVRVHLVISEKLPRRSVHAMVPLLTETFTIAPALRPYSAKYLLVTCNVRVDVINHAIECSSPAKTISLQKPKVPTINSLDFPSQRCAIDSRGGRRPLL